VSAQPHLEIAHAGDVVSHFALLEHAACAIEHADLMVGVTPVQTDEHPVDIG
jgi:hypothetical protein